MYTYTHTRKSEQARAQNMQCHVGKKRKMHMGTVLSAAFCVWSLSVCLCSLSLSVCLSVLSVCGLCLSVCLSGLMMAVCDILVGRYEAEFCIV